MQCADAALYGVKQKGKQGCMVFTKGLQATRTQLGFALQDISDNLPGAFLIYKANPADDGHKNDYVSFSFIRRDGSKIEVFDHGRIVDTTHYGRVFYVLFMSKELINRHYERN